MKTFKVENGKTHILCEDQCECETEERSLCGVTHHEEQQVKVVHVLAPSYGCRTCIRAHRSGSR